MITKQNKKIVVFLVIDTSISVYIHDIRSLLEMILFQIKIYEKYMIPYDYFEYIVQWAMKNVNSVSEICGRSVIWCTVISSLLIDGRRNKYAFYLLRC